MIQFDIPIALFIFTRDDKPLKIVKKISELKPKKLYLIGDAGRNDIEQEKVVACREKIEQAIDWNCEIIRNYAESNRGVYGNIALGAKWVFKHEDAAIFLEDDNLPELTFFRFCEEMLERYRSNDKILWICGTNYLKKYKPLDNSDYVFTQHMLPCGWASWKHKFEKYYDGELDLFSSDNINKIKKLYSSDKLYKYDISRISSEYNRKLKNERFISWDYQMAFSLRVHDLYGIVPKYNQIRNIGVDRESIHGGSSIFNIMTRRFCEIQTFPLEFPLVHPTHIQIDKKFERKTTKIILPPSSFIIRIGVKLLKRIFSIPDNMPILEAVHKIFPFLFGRKGGKSKK